MCSKLRGWHFALFLFILLIDGQGLLTVRSRTKPKSLKVALLCLVCALCGFYLV